MVASRPSSRHTRRLQKEQGRFRRWLRRLVLLVLLLGIMVTLFVFLTEPRQLPAIAADQSTVRHLYLWRDKVKTEAYRMAYPLADLKDIPAVTPEKTGGYTADDREALRALIEDKDN